MKSATVRQVRHDFGTVLDWVQDGESVEVSKRGKIVAVIMPPARPKAPRKKARPDFLARLKRIYGDKPLPGKNPILEERESYRF